MSSITRLGFIGGGNMAEAIIKGVLDQRLFFPEHVVVADRSHDRTLHLKMTFDVLVAEDNATVLQTADLILFAVKPQNMPDVMEEIKREARPEHLFVSICAGTRTSTIEEGLRTSSNPSPRVVRVMPNTPALLGLGVAGVCRGAHATEEDLRQAEQLFRAVGQVFPVREEQMDAVTALTGSGPAYVFYLIESLIEGGIAVGFEPEEARRMVLQMVLGSATLASRSDKTPQELRRAVTSPGGTTAAGIAVLDDRRVKEAFITCVLAAEQRGKELGKK